MRIWSIHPKYLDTKGLIALWRETLLAKKVLEGKTKGYKNHPQLIRFKNAIGPLNAINFYLHIIWKEAESRSYNFNKDKFIAVENIEKINVSSQQIDFEKNHLLNKLKIRDEKMYNKLRLCDDFEAHPLFHLIKGEIESWEKT